MYTRKWVVIFWDIRVTKYKFGETQHNEALKGVVLRETQGKDLKEEEIKNLKIRYDKIFKLR